MTSPEPLDLLHLGRERVIGVYLLDTDDGLALVDSGPASCAPVLKRRLSERGLALADVRHLLLTHIHLDHAGAAGTLVREHPELRVHVSPVGAAHVVDPARLEASARRIYGDDFDRLWGELAPVPEANVQVVGERVLGLECFPTPGHASHHVSYLALDRTLYGGDATGVRVHPSEFVLPPTPPPDIDVGAWHRSLDAIEARQPARLALIHFGVFGDVRRHLAELRRRLDEWAGRVERGASEQEFVTAARAETLGATREDLPAYEQAISLVDSYAGLRRYFDKRARA